MLGIIQWALETSYDYLWKADDDVYVRPDRLLALEPFDYCGCVVNFGAVRACRGWLYGLSRASMETLLQPDRTYEACLDEDVWVGLRLREFGVLPRHLEGRFNQTLLRGKPFDGPNQFPPRPDNEVIASCEYTTVSQMRKIHAAFHPEIDRKTPLIETILGH